MNGLLGGLGLARALFWDQFLSSWQLYLRIVQNNMCGSPSSLWDFVILPCSTSDDPDFSFASVSENIWTFLAPQELFLIYLAKE